MRKLDLSFSLVYQYPPNYALYFTSTPHLQHHNRVVVGVVVEVVDLSGCLQHTQRPSSM